MASARTAFDLRPSRLAEAAAACAEPYDLTTSNPTAVGLDYPAAELRAALADPGVLRYAPSPAGDPRARAAVAGYYAEAHGTQLGVERLLLTASTSEAYAWLFKLLCDPGDEVLVPRPSYPLVDYLAALEAVRPVGYALEETDRGWALDPAAVEAAVTPRTRAVVAVSPNNPTGSFLTRDEQEALLSLCAARGLALICDEVFADFAWGPDPARAGTLAGRDEALTFALSGLSKPLGLPQLKLGWIAVGGPAEARAEALARLELIADTFLSVSTQVQLAAPRLFALRPALHAAIAGRVANNRRRLAALLEPAGPVRALPAQGGWGVVLQIPRTRSDEEWAIELVERDAVLCHPGELFDFPRGGHLVVSLLPEEARFAEGARRLVARLSG